jgi:hypothetical protein
MPRGEHDALMHPRCPPLGGEVPFRHCRTVNLGLPCQRLLGCWQDRLDVLGFLRENYTLEELEPVFQPQKSRLEVMLEAVAKVKGEQE